jgi:hypothetical protein
MGYEVTDNSTMHGENTPHGLKTPHRYPISQSQSLPIIMGDLALQLYPTGRAFNMVKDGVLDKLHQAINRSMIRVLDDSQATINSCFPDNISFDINDCNLWEYRLGIVTNSSLDIETRKKAILRKMSFGRNVLARQHKDYIEAQLQLAGFDVYLHENKFFEGGEWVYKTPGDITGMLANNVQYGGDSQYGLGMQYGSSEYQIIANLSTPNESYSVGSENLWATFFIGGLVLGELTVIPAIREQEFRELVLTLKPAHLAAFTFINYI